MRNHLAIEPVSHVSFFPMHKKRLVLLSAFLSPHRSGAEAMVEEVSLRLADQYDITIVTARLSRALPLRSALTPACPVGRPCPSPKGRGGTSSVCVIRLGLGTPFDKYLFPFLAPFAARGLRPDIVHAVLESYAGFALVLCRWVVPRAKRILTLQSTNTSLFLGLIHRSAHCITAISTALIERAKKFGRSDVTLIPNGIDLVAIREACSFHAKDSGRVLFVGRLESMKGVDTLLHAFSKAIVGLSPEVHLRIVGDGSQRTSLETLAADLEIDHRVEFMRRVSPKAVLDEFAKGEIFCGLSRSEAMGNVFLEAQAAGCAVLATNTGGIPEIVKNGVSGLLVPVDDIDAAADALRRLLLDVTLRATLARDGKKFSGSYDWSVIAEEYGSIYQAC